MVTTNVFLVKGQCTTKAKKTTADISSHIYHVPWTSLDMRKLQSGSLSHLCCLTSNIWQLPWWAQELSPQDIHDRIESSCMHNEIDAMSKCCQLQMKSKRAFQCPFGAFKTYKQAVVVSSHNVSCFSRFHTFHTTFDNYIQTVLNCT